MIQSMTGYGKAVAEIANKKVTVELRAVNSKQLDLSMKVNSQYREREMEFRSMIMKSLQRGKVDLSVNVETLNESADAPHINREILKEYFNQIEDVRNELGFVQFNQQATSAAILMQTLLRMPDAIHTVQPVIEAEELDAVTRVVANAIDAFVEFRTQEGLSLYRVFCEKINNIRTLLASIEPFEKDRTERIRQNILDKLQQLPVDYDRNRLEQEMIYYIEKLDINEEKHRLENHLNYFMETMDAEMDAGGTGKKLGFIAQEMGREINTLGSKSNQAEMQRIVVRMKDELEQIKEQVLNVL
ncbi:MAG: YicC family protein [Bacteroidales bacterium]|nr:YicC family protein [Candidatus Liminaster caballi]